MDDRPSGGREAPEDRTRRTGRLVRRPPVTCAYAQAGAQLSSVSPQQVSGRSRRRPSSGRPSVERRNSQYALYAAACMRGGLQPDLLSDAGWWQSPLWTYAVFAVVIYARAAAERWYVALSEIAQRIAVGH